MDRFWSGVDVSTALVNGQDALVLRHDGVVTAVVVLDISPAGIDAESWAMNPEKL